MRKSYKTIQDYHDADQDIRYSKYDQPGFRVGFLTEKSSDVTFTSTSRNAIVLDLSGTEKHLTRMDGILDQSPTQAGDVCLIPPGLDVRFAWTIKGNQQNTIMVEFDSEIFETHVSEFANDRVANGHLIAKAHAPRPNLANLSRLLAHEIDPDQRRGRLFADTAMRLIVLEVAASHWSVPLPQLEVAAGVDARIKRAIDFIEGRFSDDISLGEISLASGLSLTQLTARFHQHTGLTPYAYVIDRRLRQAMHLLGTTEIPIAHVAIETGFSDQQHMTRAFRARLGRTPNQVRKG
jgi:AraC family transcriptional regulator